MSEKTINLAKLQSNLDDSRHGLRAAERALKRAQEARDGARAKAQAAEQVFVDATRAVLG